MTPPSDSIEALVEEISGALVAYKKLIQPTAWEHGILPSEPALTALANRVREAESRGDLATHNLIRAEAAEAEAKALREALDWLIAWTSALIDDEWGKQTRPYTGSFEPFEEFLSASESSDG